LITSNSEGLNAAPVARLKETYSIALSKIPKGIMTLDELNALASPANGFANIRKYIHNSYDAFLN
jgi:hypothetical protein